MLVAGDRCFVRVCSAQGDSELRLGWAREVTDSSCIIEFHEHIWPQAGTSVTLYADVRGKFFQQSGRVAQLLQAKPCVVIAFALEGESSPADTRSSFRVGVAAWDISARVGEDENCTLCDVSAEGIGVITNTAYMVGSMVNIRVSAQNCIVEGTMRVQSCARHSETQFRCGMLAEDSRHPLRRAVEKLSIAIQRAQLRRMAGDAA